LGGGTDDAIEATAKELQTRKTLKTLNQGTLKTFSCKDLIVLCLIELGIIIPLSL